MTPDQYRREGFRLGIEAAAEACPRCRGTGIARVSPYLLGLRDGDLHTMTACDCPAGKALLNGNETDHDNN